MTASDLRIELAATAARLIAEEGCEYGQAKRRASEMLGDGRVHHATMPDNSEVERELRRYLALFGGTEHRSTLAALRGLAAEWMRTLAQFDPHLIGAVLNGTATAYSDVHLQLFVDSAKDVELRLMNLGVDFDVDAGDGGERPAALERLSFVAASNRPPPCPARVGIRLHVYLPDAIRVSPRHKRAPAGTGMHPVEAAGRANLAALRKLLDDDGSP